METGSPKINVWTDEAREAALEARRAGAKGDPERERDERLFRKDKEKVEKEAEGLRQRLEEEKAKRVAPSKMEEHLRGIEARRADLLLEKQASERRATELRAKLKKGRR